jgi:hypothetical protein
MATRLDSNAIAYRLIAPRRLALAQPFPPLDWFLIRPYPIRLDFNASEYGLIAPRRLALARPFPHRLVSNPTVSDPIRF